MGTQQIFAEGMDYGMYIYSFKVWMSRYNFMLKVDIFYLSSWQSLKNKRLCTYMFTKKFNMLVTGILRERN